MDNEILPYSPMPERPPIWWGTGAALLSTSLEQSDNVFMGFPVLKGSHGLVAAQVEEVGEIAGIDGVMLNFPDFVPGIDGFGERAVPRPSHVGAA